MGWKKTPIQTITRAQWEAGHLGQAISTTVNLPGCTLSAHKIQIRGYVAPVGSPSPGSRIVLGARRLTLYNGTNQVYNKTQNNNRTLKYGDPWSWVLTGSTDESGNWLDSWLSITDIEEWDSAATELRWRLRWKETCE
jgi:hypothetical protein